MVTSSNLKMLKECLDRSSLALAELYITIACLFRRFDLQLHDTIRGRDVDAIRDCFIAETSPMSLGIRVEMATMGSVSQ